MTVAFAKSLVEVARSRAEWRPWVALLDAAREAAADRAWSETVPDVPGQPEDETPLLAARRWPRSASRAAAVEAPEIRNTRPRRVVSPQIGRLVTVSSTPV